MTEPEIEAVNRLQGFGLDYREIAEVTRIDRETVRTYTRRHPAVITIRIEADGYCRSCGRPLAFTAGHRTRLYCGTSCRMRFWNGHRDHIRHRTWRTYTCLCCGKMFEAGGREARKYCSRECYHQSRKKEKTG